METTAYTLMASFVHGNVLGYVIAPKGTEMLPPDKRFGVWRNIVTPVSSEVAELQEFPEDDAAKVSMEIAEFTTGSKLVSAKILGL